MAIYLRRSIRVGPLRFNLSKSGVGVSAGFKGFRVGTGPRGNYVHMGRGGIYYRATIPSSSPASSRPTAPRGPSSGRSDPIIPAGTHAPLEQIVSADPTEVTDSSSKELLEEINIALSPPRQRAIKLRALKCTQPPYLTFDGDAKDPVEPPIQHVRPLQVEDIDAGSGKTTLGSS